MMIKCYKSDGSFVKEFKVQDHPLGSGCLYVVDRDNDVKVVNNKYISGYMSGSMKVILIKRD